MEPDTKPRPSCIPVGGAQAGLILASGPPGLKAGRPFLRPGPSGPQKSLGTGAAWWDLEGRARAHQALAPFPGQPGLEPSVLCLRLLASAPAPFSRPPAALALASEQTPKGLGRAGSLGTPGFAVCPVSGCCSAHRREISFKATCSEGGEFPPSRAAGASRGGVACLRACFLAQTRGSVAGVCLCRGGATVLRGHCRLPASRLAGRLTTQSTSPWDSEGRSRQEMVRKPDFYPAGPSGGSSGLWDSWFWFITRDTGAMGSG